jgi:hypothetical protein
MKNNIIILLILPYTFNHALLWAAEERSQVILATLDKVEKKLAIAQALNEAKDYISKESFQKSTGLVQTKIMPVHQSTLEQNFLSDFYVYNPLLTLCNIVPDFLALSFNESGSSFLQNIFAISDQEKRFKFKAKTWFTDEALKWTTSTSTTKSKLTYPNTGRIYLLNAEFRPITWLSLDWNVALGENDGEGEDIDWLTSISADEYSKTIHDSDGKVKFFEANVYLRPLVLENLELGVPHSSPFAIAVNKISLDIFGGYHFHKANYRMTTGQWKTFLWTPVSGSFSLDSSYKIIHKGYRVGLRSILDFENDFKFEARMAYIPDLESKGIGWWNNRILNFVQSGGEGHGLDGEFSINYSPKQYPGFSLGAGFRYIRLVNHGGISHSDEEGLAPWEMMWDEVKSAFKGPFFELSYCW